MVHSFLDVNRPPLQRGFLFGLGEDGVQRSAKGVLVPRVVIALRPTKEITPPFHTAYPRVPRAGIEPTTYALEVRRSIPLS